MKKVTTKEFIWYLAAGLLAFLGLVAVTFGIIGYHMTAPTGQNFITAFEQKINFELRYLGLIFIGAAVVLAICVLVFNAKKADREIEKKIRREQRIAAQSSKTIEVKNAVEIVEEAPIEAKPEEVK
jgi:heme/copper-type cytochrome/quinol oxidase subunit 2